MATSTAVGSGLSETVGASRFGLRARLVVTAVVLVLLTAGGTGLTGWLIADGLLTQTASDRLRDAARTSAFLYEQRIQQASAVGHQIASRATVPGELGLRGQAALETTLEPIQALRPNYTLAIADAEGTVIAALRPEGAPGLGPSVGRLPGVTQALSGDSTTAISWTQDCTLSVSVTTPLWSEPLFGDTRQVLGIVLVSYPLDDAYVHQVQEDTGLQLSIYCQDTLVATTLPGLEPALGAAADQRVSLQVVGRGEPADILIRVWGAPLLAHYEPLRDMGGKVLGMYAVGVPARTLGDDRAVLLRVFLPIVGAIAGLAVAVGYAVAMRLTYPLRRLTTAAQQIGRGDLETPIATAGEDEVAVLARRMEEMRRSLHQTYTHLTELNKLKDEYLFSVAHEVRTPLAALLATVDILASDHHTMTADELRAAVERIARSSVRLRTLVDNVLDAGSIRAGRFKMYVAPTHLGPVVRQAVATVRPLLQEGGQRVRTELPDSLPPLLADRDRLAQVVTNLLTNAIKYAPEGDDIRLAAGVRGQMVRIAVSDHGAGIPLPDQATVFERYFRISTTPRGSPGTGLGLSIAKAIVDAHRGDIGLLSEPGAGTTVWFTIPLASPAAGETPSTPAAVPEEVAL